MSVKFVKGTPASFITQLNEIGKNSDVRVTGYVKVGTEHRAFTSVEPAPEVNSVFKILRGVEESVTKQRLDLEKQGVQYEVQQYNRIASEDEVIISYFVQADSKTVSEE